MLWHGKLKQQLGQIGKNDMKLKQLNIDIANQSVVIPYFELTGYGSGPRGFISAGLHGNEINGMATVRRFLDWSDECQLESRLNGTLTVVPVLNPSGFTHMQRRVFKDNLDPNRSFGYAEPTSFTHHLANHLSEFLRHHAFGIDIHDAGGSAALVPHSRVHSADVTNCADCTTYMGRLLGTKIIIKRDGNEHMLATHMSQAHKVPVLTVEAGGGQLLFPSYHEELLNGIRNVLSYFNMIDEEITVPDEQFFLSDRFGVDTKEPAEVTFDIRLGDRVHAGDRLGEIYYPLRHQAESLVSSMCGYVFSLWQLNQAPAGQRLYSILEDRHCHVQRTTTNMFDALEKFEVRKVKM